MARAGRVRTCRELPCTRELFETLLVNCRNAIRLSTRRCRHGPWLFGAEVRIRLGLQCALSS